ncbi:MAG: gliding motility-associated C-terminal domain-containing protein, partial [Flavobacteriaceae bacterium]|nr:gliding motility-associated C-terminal domain-containing protein [Flavobacteriaceae bacterium]
VELNAQGVATITASMIDGGSSDACGSITLSASKLTFNCSNVGMNNVTLTVTDTCGNISTCVAVVTVVDRVAPTVFCRNITVDLDQNNIAVITPAMIDNGSFDACGIASYSLDVTTFGYEDLGENPVVLTVTDVNGNVSSCTAIVTVGSVGGVAACLTIFNEFTPNDDGINDYFIIKCVELYPNNKLEVYNRWGHKVYEKQSYNNNWDGTANTGNVISRKDKLPVGTYYYVFNLGDGTPAFSGWLYIQR